MTKNRKLIVCSIVLILICVSAIILFGKTSDNKNDEAFKIVTTFYPVELITNNITKNANNVTVINIAKNVGGCVHDYELTPNDVKTIETANVFIINGADMEHFIENIKFKDVKIIDSSKNISNKEISSHIWMNINNYIEQVKSITNGLIECNPSNKEIYTSNMNEYIEKLVLLKSKYNEIEKSNVNMVIMHDSFNYYNDKINIVANLSKSHEEEISANEIKEFIENIKNTNTKVLLIDSETFDDNSELVNNIVNETNVQVFVLNLIVESQETESLDTYLDIMEYNIEILKEAINYGR